MNLSRSNYKGAWCGLGTLPKEPMWIRTHYLSPRCYNSPQTASDIENCLIDPTDIKGQIKLVKVCNTDLKMMEDFVVADSIYSQQVLDAELAFDSRYDLYLIPRSEASLERMEMKGNVTNVVRSHIPSLITSYTRIHTPCPYRRF